METAKEDESKITILGKQIAVIDSKILKLRQEIRKLESEKKSKLDSMSYLIGF